MLCEVCATELKEMSIIWRRGFTAVYCLECGMELGNMFASGFDFTNQPKIKIIMAARARMANKRPSWDEVAERVLEEHQPLWEALAAV